tara:strand:+ start:1025 stop:1930 length:906 start_codon:yes stop_codon:yes gene_type:complete
VSRKLKIGTRSSPLAIFQAKQIQKHIDDLGFDSEIVCIDSQGDNDLIAPLYELGIQGIFTKTLDTALLNNKIDIAVHSLKDVPTRLSAGLLLAAVLERTNANDVLVFKDSFDMHESSVIATSSLRRKAQWLNKYPNHRIENIRGNINLRLDKLERSTKWDGAIFAAIGLQRLQMLPKKSIILDWMVPAPAQGAIGVICRDDDLFVKNTCLQINHESTSFEVMVERGILKGCFGGCTMPLGAKASIQGGYINIEAVLLSEDGQDIVSVKKSLQITYPEGISQVIVGELLDKGAQQILDNLSN